MASQHRKYILLSNLNITILSCQRAIYYMKREKIYMDSCSALGKYNYPIGKIL
jgi:hypothetical protein